MQKDARHEAIVRMLLDRQAEDREAREKRLRRYQPCSETVAQPTSPVRLHKFAAQVPCHVSPEARALLARLKKQFPGSTISFPHDQHGTHSIVLTTASGAKRKHIGWLDQSAETEHGLFVDTDGADMLVLQFCYPQTPVKMSFAKVDAANRVEFRFAMDDRPAAAAASPSLVWATHPETEAFDDVGFRDFESFYLRFKQEVQAAIWTRLSALLSSSPAGHWRDGAYYTVVREHDAANGRIFQRTVDDRGDVVNIGLGRIYDTPAATNLLLLYLEADILADFADTYFTLCGVRSADSAALRDEFFAEIRRFWENTATLTYSYGDEIAPVLCIAQRMVPTPVQTLLLRQDWTLLRQELIDRFGEAGCDAGFVAAPPRDAVPDAAWPFAIAAAGEINVGLRFIYNRDTAYGPSAVERSLAVDSHATTAIPAEIQNVVLVAEQMPAPSDIDVAWVKQHDWILGKVLLDESFRDTLTFIGREAQVGSEVSTEFEGSREETIEHVRVFSGTAIARADGIQMDGEWKRGYRYSTSQTLQRLPSASELDSMRERLCEHIRANILHYQQAIWSQEDPQQKCLRYRMSDQTVPLDWRFELAGGAALTIDELSSRLMAPAVDAQFATYTSGQSAELDQVINMAEPLGYFGNCAVYPMHSEFGSEELFSMLHFFKAPYLAALPEPGTLDVVETPPEAAAVPMLPVVMAAAPEPEVFELFLERMPEMVVFGDSYRGDGACGIVAREEPPLAKVCVSPGRATEPAIVAPNDALIARAGGGMPRIAYDEKLMVGAAVARVHQPVLVNPGLFAGSAPVRRCDLSSTRMIIAQEARGLRPSLIAG